MDIAYPLAILLGLLLLGTLLRPLTNRLLLPFEALLLALGFGAGLLFENTHTFGLNSDVLRDLVFYVFLPLIIFSTAYSIDAPRFRHYLRPILALALPMAIVTMILTTILVYYGIGHPSGFPWYAALITGTLLIATDNRALRYTFQHLGIHKDLRTVITGEDLLTSAMGVVLFTLLLYFASNPHIPLDSNSVSWFILWNLLGGTIIGLVIGFLALVLLRIRNPLPTEAALLTLLVTYLSYILAEQVIHVSGIVCVLVVALIMGRTMHQDLDAPRDHFVDEFWHFNASFSSYLLYLILGMSISLAMFSDRWLAILIGIGAVAIARVGGMLLMMPLLTRPGRPMADLPRRNLLYFTGARGAITVGLVLSVPVSLDFRWTIESIGFGVVVFTLLAQAPLLGLLKREQSQSKT